MLFNSLPFLFLFLPIVLGVAVRLQGGALLRWICFSSLVFYACAGHAWFLVPMAITIVADFQISQRLYVARGKRRIGWLLLSLTANLGLLAYYKYSGLFAHTAQWIAGLAMPGGRVDTWSRFFPAILPAGISFYTFQTLSYVIDVYRGELPPERDFFAFVAFVSFFPHLVAGPLTRHSQLIPSLKAIARTGIRPHWRAGIYLFAIGLCKKVLIADRLADFVDPLLGGASPLSFLSGWLALLGYTFQIYFDFSGYSDMAIGLGRLFAIELPQNFDRPYCAVNPGDFWRRWHITLSQWLRDYLYIPLGGNRCSRAERDRNVMITMVLGGLWHGARWTFAAWGLYHGCLLIVWGRLREPWERLPVFLQRSLTFLLVSVGWLPFRAPSFTLARSWAAALLGRHGWGWEVLDPRLGAFLGLLAVAAAVVQLVPPASRWPGWDTLGNLGQFFLAAASAGAVLLLNYSSRFLYFQF